MRSGHASACPRVTADWSQPLWPSSARHTRTGGLLISSVPSPQVLRLHCCSDLRSRLASSVCLANPVAERQRQTHSLPRASSSSAPLLLRLLRLRRVSRRTAPTTAAAAVISDASPSYNNCCNCVTGRTERRSRPAICASAVTPVSRLITRRETEPMANRWMRNA